jgi:hypothetical protein
MHRATSSINPIATIGMRVCLGLLAWIFAHAFAVSSDAPSPDSSSFNASSLEVLPANIVATPRYPARFSILLRTNKGEVVDISQHPELQIRLSEGTRGEIANGWIEFRSTGKSELEVQWRGLSARVPIETTEDPLLAYDREVTSLLTRSGCNLGTCHGNLHGKGGMRLSLRGDDPAFDYYRLSREYAQRRIDLWEPSASLLLRKATSQVAHQGGKRFDVDSVEYHWLREWIETGAIETQASPLVSLEVYPRMQRMLPGELTARLIVQAKFADGSIRDVTRWARIEPSTATGIELQPDGSVRAQGPIDVSFGATYLSGRASGRIVFLGNSQSTASETPSSNPIDAIVEAQCKELNLTEAPQADDWTLVRRFYLVALGRLPRPEETLAFVADDRPNKIESLVDRLLADPAFDYAWAMRWSDLIRNEDKVMSPKGAAILHDWLRQQMASDRSMQSWISELVSSVGSTYETPPASYHRTHRDPLTTAESAAQVFLGVRVQCAKCHNHPFDRWKQDDYYGMAAYFTTIERKQIDNKPKDELDKHIITGDEIISLSDRPAETLHPGRSQTVPPRPLPFNDATSMHAGSSHVEESSGTVLERFGRWLTVDNSQFDANLANRIWFQYFGRGIVDSPDDFRDSNPPTNSELLRWLAAELRRENYSMKQLSRTILCSQTFARQSGSDQPVAQELSRTPYFAAYPTRRLAAETMLDAVSDACDYFPQVQAGYEEGAPTIRRAMEMPGVPVKKGFLKTFGKPDRLLVCECERTNAVSLGQSLSLVNGKEIRDRISHSDNRIGRLMSLPIPFSERVEELFLAALCRKPNAREQEAVLAMLEANTDRPKNVEEVLLAVQQAANAKQYSERRVLEDVLWALINSKEFAILR